MRSIVVLTLILLMMGGILTACDPASEEPAGGTTSPGTTVGISGTVSDANGPLSGVQLHVVYELASLATSFVSADTCMATERLELVTNGALGPQTDSGCVVLCLDRQTTIRVGPILQPYARPWISVYSACDCADSAASGFLPAYWAWTDSAGLSYAWSYLNPQPGATPGCLTVRLDSIVRPFGVSANFIPEDGSVRITWSTAAEENLSRFDIQRNSELISTIQATGSATGHNYAFTDESVFNTTTYFYELLTVDLIGNRTVVAADSVTPRGDAGVPTEYALRQNYPNPVVDTARIVFDLPAQTRMTLAIFDRLGNTLATLVDATLPAGRHQVDYAMNALPNGLYEYRATMGATMHFSKWLLKNCYAESTLRQSAAAGITNAHGAFTFTAVYGDTVSVIDDQARLLGPAVFQRAQIVAIKDGYQTAGTLLNLSDQSSWHLNILLQPVIR